MQKAIIYEPVHDNLLPLTYTRPCGALRIGIDTIAEKWQAMLPAQYSWRVQPEYLAQAYPRQPADSNTLFIAGNILPTPDIAAQAAALATGQQLAHNGRTIAYRGHCGDTIVEACTPVAAIDQLYHIFLLNADAINADFHRITAGTPSQPISPTNTIIGDPALIHIAPGATVEGAYINTTRGPVYIGPDAEIMEGSMLRGPIAVCQGATVNMGTKIYGATTIGPYCKVGGEINNVVFQGYSNKAHDGFLGNAVIGQWCNIGAGTVASNLKNDYTPIRLWNYPAGRFLRTDLQFCGLIMGDHSKTGINTMINTATVLGVGVNIHGSGFPRNFVASFSEGSTAGYTDVSMTKFFETAARMMQRRNITLTETDKAILMAVRNAAEAYK